MQSADNIAKWFLSFNKDCFSCGDADFISNLKLQKLLYYAQGLHLASNDTCLFNEPIMAWSYGPVIESVYDSYKINGSEPIKSFSPPLNNFSDSELDTLYLTHDMFGQYSAWKLSDLTHSETPWRSTPLNHIISTDIIRDYFKQHYIDSGEYHMSLEMRQCLADCRAGRNLIGPFNSTDELFKSLEI